MDRLFNRIFIGFYCLVMMLVSHIKFRYIAYAVGIVPLAAGLFYGGMVLHKTLTKSDPSLTSHRLATAENAFLLSSVQKRKEAKEETDQEMYSKAASYRGIGGKLPGTEHCVKYFRCQRDYIFSIIVEETGLVGGIAVIGLYMWLLWRDHTRQKMQKTFSAMLVSGLGV